MTVILSAENIDTEHNTDKIPVLKGLICIHCDAETEKE